MTMLEKTRAKQGLTITPATPPAAKQPADGAAEPTKQKRKRKKLPPDSAAGNDARAGRLPDGARFTVSYSAEKQEWSGILDRGARCRDSRSSGRVRRGGVRRVCFAGARPACFGC